MQELSNLVRIFIHISPYVASEPLHAAITLQYDLYRAILIHSAAVDWNMVYPAPLLRPKNITRP